MHFFAPEDLPPLRKHVSFVLDVSGSMSGRKMEQLKEAMNTILDDLNANDTFSIAIFSSSVQVRCFTVIFLLIYIYLFKMEVILWDFKMH